MELRCSSSGSVTVRQAGSEAASGVHRPGSDAWSGSRVRSQQSSMLEQKFLPNQMLLATGHRPGSGLLFVKHQWGRGAPSSGRDESSNVAILSLGSN